jgi:hypothetical protein
MPRLVRFALASLLVAACANPGAYDEDWGADTEIASGKADGLLDSAQKLAFDEVGTGYVEGEQMDIYAIDLRGADKITAVMTRTSGDLDPSFTLYYGGSKYISSASFTRSGASITKTYELEFDDSGRYYVAVRPYQNRGAGNYTIKFSCSGGPCAGESVVRSLELAEKVECITKARTCSLAALPQWNGAVGAARARTIFQDCLAAALTDEEGSSCAAACDEPEQAKPLCESIISALPFYADQDAACFQTLNGCLEDCEGNSFGGGHWDDDELWEMPVSICWDGGFNGNCDSYARDHAACGGTYEEGSVEQCHEYCESTFGAWNDDLDTVCTEDCGDRPEEP